MGVHIIGLLKTFLKSRIQCTSDFQHFRRFSSNNRSRMKLFGLFSTGLILSILLHLSMGDEGAAAPEKKPVKKLQIGGKKRVENCEQKSRRGDLLSMHYTGKLEDGTEFDSSIPRGQPLQFTLGSGQVIKGWDQGLLGMCVGEKRKLVIPPELGYGSSGAPPKIPGNSVLVFEVELTKIDRKDEL